MQSETVDNNTFLVDYNQIFQTEFCEWNIFIDENVRESNALGIMSIIKSLYTLESSFIKHVISSFWQDLCKESN